MKLSPVLGHPQIIAGRTEDDGFENDWSGKGLFHFLLTWNSLNVWKRSHAFTRRFPSVSLTPNCMRQNDEFNSRCNPCRHQFTQTSIWRRRENKRKLGPVNNSENNVRWKLKSKLLWIRDDLGSCIFYLAGTAEWESNELLISDRK